MKRIIGTLSVPIMAGVLLTLAACDRDNSLSGGVYGVWVADPGYVVTIAASGTYRLCHELECVDGTVRTTTDPTAVYLEGFYRSSLGERFGADNLGDAVTFERHRQTLRGSDLENDLLFSVPARISWIQAKHCRGTPAQLNAAEGGICFRRVLVFEGSR